MIKLLMLLALVSCAAPEKKLSLDQLFKIHKEKQSLALKLLKEKYFSNRKNFPTLYASFGNTNYFFGEKLRILRIAIPQLQFDGKYSSETYLNERGQKENFPYGLESSLGFNQFPYEFKDAIKDPVLYINFLVEGENFNRTVIKSKADIQFLCGSKTCNFTEKKNITSIKVTFPKVGYFSYFSFDDPLKSVRSNQEIVNQLYQRRVWVGMKTHLLNLYDQLYKKEALFLALSATHVS